MSKTPNLEDLIGIEHPKLGFYQELQIKIEQLKQTNQELLEHRSEIQTLLDCITDMMLVLSDDFVIKRVNDVVLERFPGVDPVSMHCYTLLKKQDKPCDDCPVKKVFETEEVVTSRSCYMVDGELKHFELVASPLKTSNPQERLALLFKRDVTLEQEYQDKFYQAEKMATVGTLAAGVAHEINNPLAAISGFAEGLQRRIKKIEGNIDEDILADFKEYTEIILSECGRCRDIVRTLLSFSRPIEAKWAPVDVNRCINDMLFILKHHFRDRHGVVLATDLDPELPLIFGDESQIKQVIVNLVTNAFDATGAGGKIEIITRRGIRGNVEFFIEDTGVGIPAEIQNKLFEPFFTTKLVGQGVGIGLSMCYNIVRNHHGGIFVCSDAESGTSFKISLPAME